jgi:hypothetical protein
MFDKFHLTFNFKSQVSTDVCGCFLHKSHSMAKSNLCVSIDMQFIFCASFCMSNVRNLQKLCQKYTLMAGPRSLLDDYIALFVPWLRFECRRKAHCDLHAIKILNSDIEEG